MTSPVRFGELCPLAANHARHDSSSATDMPLGTHNRLMSGRGCPGCRLLRHVEITSTCWLWLGSKYTQFGQPTYGQTILDGRRMTAHRAMYLLAKGPIPDHLELLHSCDVKACVNPAHLRVGTHRENVREAFAKMTPGRLAGENAGRARLTWPQVRAIRAASASGESYADLSRQYGVTATQIRNIVLRLRWTEPVQTEAVA